MKIVGRPTNTPTDPKKFGGATDAQVAAAVAKYIAENPVNAPSDEQVEQAVAKHLANGISVKDQTTGKAYTLYVDNGRLTMAESEE